MTAAFNMSSSSAVVIMSTYRTQRPICRHCGYGDVMQRNSMLSTSLLLFAAWCCTLVESLTMYIHSPQIGQLLYSRRSPGTAGSHIADWRCLLNEALNFADRSMQRNAKDKACAKVQNGGAKRHLIPTRCNEHDCTLEFGKPGRSKPVCAFVCVCVLQARTTVKTLCPKDISALAWVLGRADLGAAGPTLASVHLGADYVIRHVDHFEINLASVEGGGTWSCVDHLPRSSRKRSSNFSRLL